jgi:predicted double-glycine peptidase
MSLGPPPLAAVACAALACAAADARPRGRMPVRSLAELRSDGVVRQTFDLSCGAAALGTVLTEHGDPVSEPEVLAALARLTDPERVKAHGGFTLLDLKRYAVSRGYTAQGYGRLRLETLVPLAPAIVPTLVAGQPHFMVFRGIAGGRAVLADPAFGNRSMTVAQFEELWTPRIAFVVSRPRAAGSAAPAPPRPTVVPPEVVRGVLGGMR